MDQTNVTLFFEGRRLEARPGDSIAVALFNAGVRVLSYSVKYRRPRGIHCARGRCIMCHMEVDGVPGVPTCITPVSEGMQVRREDSRPLFAPLLTWAARLIPFPAGFYYRMFTRPAFVRKLFIGSLRRMAGVGHVRSVPVRTSSRERRALASRYDVVVVGAGLSGLSAALSAARHGVSVLLVDEYVKGGGHALGFNAEGEKTSVRDDLLAKILASPSIEYLSATTAQAFYPPDTILLGPGGALGKDGSETGGLCRVRSSAFVFATGAYDVVPLFANNDTPGIFGSRAIRLLLERDGLRPGSRAAVYGTGNELADLSRLLIHHGIGIAAIIDGAATVPGTNDGLPRDVPLATDAVVTSAHGNKWLSSVTIANRKAPDGRKRIECDLLCIGFPGQGAYELAFQSGFEFKMSDGPLDETKVMRPSQPSTRNEAGVSFFVVGDLAGQTSWAKKVRAGEEAGALAAGLRQPSQKE